MRKILVLNMGMKSIRSIVFTEYGEKLSFSSRPLSTQLDEEKVMQNPAEWWEKAKIVIHESMKDLVDRKIDYVTVTTSSACLVYVDENGEALDRCIMVSDKRAEKESQFIKGLPEFQEIRNKTDMEMDPYLMLPKILWVKNNQRELYDRTYKFLSSNDYLIELLTGKYYTDIFNAQKYHYDIKSNTYPEQLLSAMGIGKEKLPAIGEPGTSVGHLTPHAAEALGLSTETEVILSTYDAICSFFGSGVTKEGEASDASGTVTAFRALSFKTNLKQSSKIFITPFAKWNLNIVGGSNNLGGGLIEWAKQCYYKNEMYPYEVMEKEAGEVMLGAGGLIFLPYLLGERAPLWDYDARGVFFGLERSHTRKNMTRAIFESTGFIDLDMINAIEETGMEVSKIKFSGGLARNNLVAQIKADITGRQVEILDDFETTAVGAAMLALVGQHVCSDLWEASERFVQVRMIVNPNFKRNKQYQEVYKVYKDTYEALKGAFSQRMKMVHSIYDRREVSIENL